jgi:glycosyltransferase involved in cell wall biosynthesis
MSEFTKISVIIPVYNAELYLHKCLDSILNQTLQDFEVIFVDDGSTDSSLNILNEYAKTDSRIIVLNQENQGQGNARNLGIANAKGEYIYFMDQDDWIDNNLFEKAYKKGKDFDADIVEVPFIYEFGSKSKISTLKFKMPDNKVFDYKINKNYLFGTSFAGWSRFVKRELIEKENIQFSKYRSLEDFIYTIKAKIYAKKIVSINKQNYHYKVRSDSDLNSKKYYKTESIKALHEVKQLLIDTDLYNKYKKDFTMLTILSLVDTYKCIPDENLNEFLQNSKLLLEKDYKKFLKYLERDNRSFFQRIFCLRNEFKGDNKQKILTIFNRDFIICENMQKSDKKKNWCFLNKDVPRILVHFHLYYHDQIDFYIEKFKNITDCDWDFFVTYVEENEESNKKILELKPDAKLILVENVGYDVWPFISVIKSVNLDEYDYVIKMHTKSQRNDILRFKHILRTGYWWRNELVNTLLKSKHRFRKVLRYFDNKNVGMVFSRLLLQNIKSLHKAYRDVLEDEVNNLDIKTKCRNWCAGTMFIARSDIFKFLQDNNITIEHFPKKMCTGAADSKAHIFEAIFGIEVVESGYEFKPISNGLYDTFCDFIKAEFQQPLQWLFCLTNIGNEKILTIMGIRIKICDIIPKN